MSDSARLLRMLEPAVRPGGLPAPQRPATLPIEQRSFESLLEDARQSAQAAGATNDPGPSENLSSGLAAASERSGARMPSVAPLAGLDCVENASLRQLMAGQSGPSNRSSSSGS